MSTDTTTTPGGQFFAAPPMAAPVMPWRPEYGTIEDKGETVHVGGDVYVYSSPDFSFDVNTIYAITPDGVVVLDTQMLPRHAEAVLADIRARTDQPIRYVTNSHHHPDHIYGNLVFQEAGAELVSSYFTARLIDGSAFWYLMFLSGIFGEHLPRGYAVPRDTFVRSRELWLGKTAVQLFEFADSTTTAGESVDMTMAWFPQSKVLHVGDTIWPGSHTFFADGVSVPDWFIQLGHIRELVNELKPRVIVPGHGAPGDAGMIDVQERYLRAVVRMVEDHCRGGEVALTDEAKAKLRQDIVNEFPQHRNHLPLDISLQMVQMLGPMAFLLGRPDGATAQRLPSFL
ncbi:MAG TPA: MBL fold metallo-hydrolase [Acidimicrobiales bacterium]|nr:MBL fold metallo-hydrolase [Acidimicrobiales bacterium]